MSSWITIIWGRDENQDQSPGCWHGDEGHKQRWSVAVIYTVHEILNEIKRMKKGIMLYKSCCSVTRKWAFFTVVYNTERDSKEMWGVLFQKTGETTHKLCTQLHRMAAALLLKPPADGGGVWHSPLPFSLNLSSLFFHTCQKAKEKLSNLWDAIQRMVHSAQPGKYETTYQLITCP